MTEDLPAKILFVCNMNSIRSPMAEVLARKLLPSHVHVDSAGVYEGEMDFFIESILAEEGLRLSDYRPKMLSSLDVETFDLIVTLTNQATEAAAELGAFSNVEYWDIANPTDIRGSRDLIMNAYRTTLEQLKTRIIQRFSVKKEQ